MVPETPKTWLVETADGEGKSAIDNMLSIWLVFSTIIREQRMATRAFLKGPRLTIHRSCYLIIYESTWATQNFDQATQILELMQFPSL